MTHPAERLPTRVRSLIAATGLAGLAICSVAWVVACRAPISDQLLGRAAAVAVVILVGDVALLQIRLGRNGNGFTWAEAALVVGVAIGGWAWLIALLGPVILGGQPRRGPALDIVSTREPRVGCLRGWRLQSRGPFRLVRRRRCRRQR